MYYEAQHRRLRVAGVCGDDDVPTLCEAVRTLTRTGDSLIVDLTAVTAMTAEVADALLAAQALAQAMARTCRVTLLRKSRGPVDRCLRAALPESCRGAGPGRSLS